MSEVVRTLSQTEVDVIRTALLQMQSNATSSSKAFTFVAAFDGTNNDRDNVPLSRTPQETNVAGIARQIAQANSTATADGSLTIARYYKGVGTGGETGGLMAAGPFPTEAVMYTAKQALTEFSIQARDWLAANPTKTVADLSTAITGFSRGCATGIVFMQLLNEQGLKIGDNVIAAPGAVKVSAAILLDPVVTGIDRPMVLPSNISGNVFVLRAFEETRKLFPAADFSNDPRVQTFTIAGNHGNIGGFYDNGIGALVLDGMTQTFKQIGIKVADVPGSRAFDSDPTHLPKVYTEAYSTIMLDGMPERRMNWNEGGTGNERSKTFVPKPVITDGPGANVRDSTITPNADGTTKTKTISFLDGDTQEQLLVGDRIVLIAESGQHINSTGDGQYAVSYSSGQSLSYNSTTGETTILAPGAAGMVLSATGTLVRLIEPTSGVSESVLVDGEIFFVTASGALYRHSGDAEIEIRSLAGESGAFLEIAATGGVSFASGYVTKQLADGSIGRAIIDSSGEMIGLVVTHRYDDGSYSQETLLNNGIKILTAFDDGGKLASQIKTTPDGVAVMSEFDADAKVVGTITDTPDGTGGIDRVVSTMVDGKLVEITQHVVAGNTDTTDLNIGGQDAVNSDLIEDAIDANYVSAIDIIRARGTGDLRQYMAAGDAANLTGIYTVSNPPGTPLGTPWYNTPGAQYFGSYLSGVQSFVAGYESGDPRIIATTLVNMFAPGSNLAGGLNGVSDLLGLKTAWERGDGVRVLLSGISVANDVLKAYGLILEWQAAIIRATTSHLTDAVAQQALDDILAEQAALKVFSENLGKVLPYLGALIKLSEGEYLDAVILTVATLMGYGGPVGWAVAFVDIWEAMGTDTLPRGIATVVAAGTDGLDTAIEPSGNNFGGGDMAVAQMAPLLNLLRTNANAIPNHGVVAERVPVLEMNGNVWTLRITDPDTGAQTLRDFDHNGNMIGETVNGVWLEVAGTENFHANLVQQFKQLAVQMRAYAPNWELATIFQQHQNKLPRHDHAAPGAGRRHAADRRQWHQPGGAPHRAGFWRRWQPNQRTRTGRRRAF